MSPVPISVLVAILPASNVVWPLAMLISVQKMNVTLKG